MNRETMRGHLEDWFPSRPGETWLVAVCGDEAATLWAFGVPSARTELGDLARHIWLDVLAATMREVRPVWRSPEILDAMELRCRQVGEPIVRSTGRYQDGLPIGAVDGASFGLAFFLAQASRLCDCPIPDVAATAAVGQGGLVLPVDAVGLKTEALVRLAPQVETLLVAPENFDEAFEEVARKRGGLKVVAVQSVREAFELVFGDKPKQRLIEYLSDSGRRAQIIADLFEMALTHERRILTWSAVAEAASIVRSNGELPPTDDFRVRFAEAVALRHHCNARGDMSLPSEETLSAMPAPVRVNLVAHLVQHSADTGVPGANEVLALANAHMVRGPAAFSEHLRLLGAVGRLMAVTGYPREALDMELEAAEGYLERLEYREISWPLSVAMRLAGALMDRKSYERAVQVWERVDAERLDATSRRFVEHARTVAKVLLGEADDDVVLALKALADDLYARDHLRYSAHRYLIQAHRQRGESELVAKSRERLYEDVAKSPAARSPHIALALVRLDEDPYDLEAWQDLCRWDPGVTGHLERVARERKESPGIVASRFYPY